MAPVLSLNPKAEVTTLPPEKINPEDVVSVKDHIEKSHPVQDIKHLGKFCESIDAYSIDGKETFSLPALHFSYVLYRENLECWKTITLGETTCPGDIGNLLNKMSITDGLELIKTDSLEVKGSFPMYHFVAEHTYEVILWVKMNEDAQFKGPFRFTLVIADGHTTKVAAKFLHVNDIPPEKLMRVKLGEFKGTGNGEEVRFSLIDFDPNWKSGIVLVGLFIERVYV